jgi:hypothetical protein
MGQKTAQTAFCLLFVGNLAPQVIRACRPDSTPRFGEAHIVLSGEEGFGSTSVVLRNSLQPYACSRTGRRIKV